MCIRDSVGGSERCRAAAHRLRGSGLQFRGTLDSEGCLSVSYAHLDGYKRQKRDNLEKSGDLTKMLNYGKSDLVKVKPTFGGESFELDARLSFKKDGEGNRCV